ncbi:MAG: hypothetical protein LUH05_07055, partial [Candidatus Gastranaerophilales bacterium]|nr:hypothetical protein [Candidatus Gastranaerophilales bacterium]
PDKDYKNTYLKLKLSPHDINLPANITAKIKKNALTGYVDIEYPDSPSLKKIKNYDVIRGRAAKDINSALSEKLGDEEIDKIVDDASSLVSSANVTVQNLGEVFSEVNGILKDMRGDILTASSNLAKTTANLENISANLNNSLDKETIKNSVENIENTTKNIEQITSELNNITEQIDKASVPIVNSILCETNSTVVNIKEITGGIKNTLKKHMGLSRLIFGRPISKDCD